MSEIESTSAAFAERKEAAVIKAKIALGAARERLDKALAEYQAEVTRHEEERGDGFFSAQYVITRKAAVLARKNFESKTSALATARAEQDAATITLEDAS
jgi:uncharacterized protein involved in exopolysaccharide biosynthesis